VIGVGSIAAGAVTGKTLGMGMGAGLILVCAGTGFLISAGVTYRLAKSWGMLEK
jgi:hypothetical protein